MVSSLIPPFLPDPTPPRLRVPISYIVLGVNKAYFEEKERALFVIWKVFQFLWFNNDSTFGRGRNCLIDLL